MRLTDKQIEEIVKVDPYNSCFDICSICGGVENYGQMSGVNEVDFDLICNDCKGGDWLFILTWIGKLLYGDKYDELMKKTNKTRRRR